MQPPNAPNVSAATRQPFTDRWDVQRIENLAFRRGYDSGFRAAMSAVKNSVGRELEIHRDAHKADMERLGDA